MKKNKFNFIPLNDDDDDDVDGERLWEPSQKTRDQRAYTYVYNLLTPTSCLSTKI